MHYNGTQYTPSLLRGRFAFECAGHHVREVWARENQFKRYSIQCYCQIQMWKLKILRHCGYCMIPVRIWHARYCVSGIIELNFWWMLNKFKLYSFNLKINILNRYFNYSSSLGTNNSYSKKHWCTITKSLNRLPLRSMGTHGCSLSSATCADSFVNNPYLRTSRSLKETLATCNFNYRVKTRFVLGGNWLFWTIFWIELSVYGLRANKTIDNLTNTIFFLLFLRWVPQKINVWVTFSCKFPQTSTNKW